MLIHVGLFLKLWFLAARTEKKIDVAYGSLLLKIYEQSQPQQNNKYSNFLFKQ